jgi:hypothetical protein
MLNKTQRWIVFFLFCVFTTICVGVEVYLVYSIVQKEFSNIKLISAFLNTTVLVWIGRKFGEMTSRTFLQSSVMPPHRLHRFASERCGIIENAIRSDQDPYLTRQNLITNTLKFSEESLRGWITLRAVRFRRPRGAAIICLFRLQSRYNRPQHEGA